MGTQAQLQRMSQQLPHLEGSFPMGNGPASSESLKTSPIIIPRPSARTITAPSPAICAAALVHRSLEIAQMSRGSFTTKRPTLSIILRDGKVADSDEPKPGL